MFLSVFDIYKIGIGPSASHTMGPMSAAARFLDEILNGDWPRPSDTPVAKLHVSLHGSLAYTGVGHATDRAVILGLAGYLPDTIDPDQMDAIIDTVKTSKTVQPEGHPSYRFDPANNLVLDKRLALTGHANGMMFQAFDAGERLLLKRIYYSIGGGFVVDEDELEAMQAPKKAPVESGVPYPFRNAKEMLEMAKSSGLSIAQMKRANEEVHLSRHELNERLDRIWTAMDRCVDRGISTTGIMPGGLKVKRRAKAIHDKLQEEWKQNRVNPLLANDWLSVYAMAVNEENAAGGKVVTSPTNGAAGVVPAVLRYYMHFHADATIAREFATSF